MAYTAFAVAGTLLQYANSSPWTFSTIRGVEGFSGPTATKPDIDVTAIDDTAAQSIDGTPDYGQVTFDLFWDPAETNHQLLKDDFDVVGAVAYFKVIYADTGAAVATFQGNVKGFEWDHSKGNAVKVKVTVKLSGAVQVVP
jgi:hypothetical protein